MPKVALFTALIVAALLAGCSQVVHVPYSQFELPVTTGIKTKVLIQPPAVEHQQQYEQSGLFVVGLLNSWQVDFNKTLSDAVRDAVNQTYNDVVIGNSCEDCGLIIRPRITQIDIEKLSMQSSVELRLDILDAKGNKIIQLHSGGQSAFLSGSRISTGVAGYFIPFLGTAVGTHVVKETVTEALDAALADIANQLEYQANSGLLSRSWLPKNFHRNKTHGRHEYTAELVAKSAGCNMSTDGIALTQQKYFQETYLAHCWGKPEFAISCAYGRCEIKDESQVAQSEDSSPESNL